MPPILISGKPEIVDPPDMVGSLLMVPLNEAPEAGWQRFMEWPTDNITVEGTALRIPMTAPVRANVGAFLSRLEAAMAKANDIAAQQAERGRQVAEQHQKQANLAKEKMATDLDAWWSEKETP